MSSLPQYVLFNIIRNFKFEGFYETVVIPRVE